MSTWDFAPHPIADLFPMMSEKDISELSADLRENGLLEPVVLFEGKILDGRNRYAACEKAGVSPRFVEWKGEGGSPLRFVLSHNLHRRHLTTAQRAAVAVEIMPMFEEEARKRQGQRTDIVPNSAQSSGRSRQEAAKVMEVGHSTVGRAKQIKETSPETFEQLKSGEFRSVEAAHRAAGLPGSDSGRSGPKVDAPPRPATERQIAAFTRAVMTAVQACLNLREVEVPGGLPAEVREQAAGDLREAVAAANRFRRLTEENGQ